MSKPVDVNQDGDESILEENRIVDGENDGEESDEYGDIDDEEERQIEGEEEEEEGEKGQNTLTHLLLGNTNGVTATNEVEDHEDEEDLEDEGEEDEYVDDDEDEDEDPDYVAPSTINKKRSIDEVVEKEASQGSKKVKA